MELFDMYFWFCTVANISEICVTKSCNLRVIGQNLLDVSDWWELCVWSFVLRNYHDVYADIWHGFLSNRGITSNTSCATFLLFGILADYVGFPRILSLLM